MRFFTLTVPGRRRAVGIDLLAADRRVLGTAPGPDPPDLPPPARRARAGVTVTRIARAPCTDGGPGPCRALLEDAVQVWAPCATRRITVVALAPGLAVRIAGGRTTRGRAVELPGRIGVPGRVAVAVLPRGAAPVSVAVSERSRAGAAAPRAAPARRPRASAGTRARPSCHRRRRNAAHARLLPAPRRS